MGVSRPMLYAVKWWRHPMCISLTIARYAVFMLSLHSDLTRAVVVTDVLYSVRSELPHQGNTPTVLFIGLWPHSFHKIVYLYSIVWHLLRAVMPLSQNISAILT